MGLAGVDRLLRAMVGEGRDIPGAVLLVRLEQEVVFHEAYGFRQRVPALLPMGRGTLFDLASVTKPLVCGLLGMLLWRRGGIHLDQTPQVLSGCRLDPGKSGITVRHLLCNRSGLPAWRPFFQDCRPEDCPVPAEEVLERILSEPLEAPPGTREVYSDLGFMVVGGLLEQIGGFPLDDLFRRELSQPLGLTRTGFHRLTGTAGRQQTVDLDVAATEFCTWRGRVLCGEVHDENCYMLGGVSGHAGLFSNAGDLDRIVLEIFRGLGNKSGLFDQEGLRVFFQRQGGGVPGTWALGWDTPSPRNSATGSWFSPGSVGHNGFTGTSLWIDLDRRISVVLLTNRVHPSRENPAIRALRPQVHDAILAEFVRGKRGPQS